MLIVSYDIVSLIIWKILLIRILIRSTPIIAQWGLVSLKRAGITEITVYLGLVSIDFTPIVTHCSKLVKFFRKLMLSFLLLQLFEFICMLTFKYRGNDILYQFIIIKLRLN